MMMTLIVYHLYNPETLNPLSHPHNAFSSIPYMPPQASFRLMFLPLISCPELPLSFLKHQKETLHRVSNPSLFTEGYFYCLSIDKTWIPPKGTGFLAALSNEDCPHPSIYSRTRRQSWQTAGSSLSCPQTTSSLSSPQTPKSSTTWLHTLYTQPYQYHLSI